MTAVNKYLSKYSKLKPMSDISWSGMFGNGASSHGKSLITRAAKEILPNVWSFDPRVMNFQRELSLALNEACPIDMNEDKFTKNGIYSTFDRLRTVPGYMMGQMSYMPLHNEGYREELGLRPGYSTTERLIAKELWREVFSHYKPAPVKITKKSAGGVRRNTSDHVWKKDWMDFVFVEGNLTKILSLVKAGDWKTLANDFEMLFMMYVQKRDQVDTPGKPRLVFDLEYALSNGKRGKSFNADKKVVIEGKEWEDFSATRARVINAGPWVINGILSTLFTGHLQAMFERFPDVWHINTPTEIKSVLDGKYLYAGDVKEYDRSMPEEAIDVFHEELKEWWPEEIVEMSEALYYSAYFARPLSIDGGESALVGNPRDFRNRQVVAGNRSGHSATTIIAKGNKVIETLHLFHLMGFKVIGNVRSFLENKEAIGVVNNGDDEVIHTSDIGLMAAFKKVREDVKNSIYIVTPEDGVVYSGMVLSVEKYGDTVYKPVPRLTTAFEKIYCPERSIGGLFRSEWHIGIMERINSRDLHPSGGAAWEVHDRLYHDMMAPHFGTLFGMISDAIHGSSLRFDALSAADKDVMYNNDRAYYKYKDGEVSQHILDAIMVSYPYSSYAKFVESSYSGTIMKSNYN